MTDDGWDDAPDGQLLAPGDCGELDTDGQGCARGLVHPLSPHQHTGLRAWLETSPGRAVIRIYDQETAEAFEAMEAPLFERFGYQPIARQAASQTKVGGLRRTSVMLHDDDGLAALGPSQRVTFRVLAVCYARAD
jgi:hypothetical protein